MMANKGMPEWAKKLDAQDNPTFEDERIALQTNKNLRSNYFNLQTLPRSIFGCGIAIQGQIPRDAEGGTVDKMIRFPESTANRLSSELGGAAFSPAVVALVEWALDQLDAGTGHSDGSALTLLAKR